jgi:hypothetical protein
MIPTSTFRSTSQQEEQSDTGLASEGIALFLLAELPRLFNFGPPLFPAGRVVKADERVMD